LLRASAAGALSGALLIACFPRIEAGALAWLALVPLLYFIAGSSSRPSLLAAISFALVFHSGNLYWVSEVMVRYGGLAWPIALVILMFLVAYLTAFDGVFAILTSTACARRGAAGVFAAPVFWVGLELLRQFPWGGFPWCLLGYSQVTYLPALQLTSITGVYGVSLLIVLVNAAIAYALAERGPGKARRVLLASAPVVVLLALALGFGYAELARPLPPPDFRVAAVQGSVLQEHKWDPGFAADIFSRHLALSEKAADAGSRLIVWPESSTPFNFDETPPLADAMRELARKRSVYLLFGSDDYEFLDGDSAAPGAPRSYRAYNGAKLIDPRGEISFRYHKIVLVPFGEYVPLRRLLFFVNNLTQEVGGFTPGSQIVVGHLGEGRSLGVFICYEAIYPDLVRRFSREGAGLLVQLTNDAWFGRSSAPYQHFAMATVRAIESRRYLLRAANTGISAVVDPRGRVLATTELFRAQVLEGAVSFRSDLTFYARHGDLLARAAAVLTCLFGLTLATRNLRARLGRAGRKRIV